MHEIDLPKEFVPIFKKEHPTYLAYIQFLKNNRLVALYLKHRLSSKKIISTHILNRLFFLWGACLLVNFFSALFVATLFPVSENPCLSKIELASDQEAIKITQKKVLMHIGGYIVVLSLVHTL